MRLTNQQGRELLAKKAKKRTYPETEMQKAFVTWFKAVFPQYRHLLIHVPNEGKRSPAHGSHLKKQGLLPGCPDNLVAVPKNGKNGLFIEMKVKGGKVSDNQSMVIAELAKQGYEVEIAWSLEEAKWTVLNYLNP